jgi:hypothetical protein
MQKQEGGSCRRRAERSVKPGGVGASARRAPHLSLLVDRENIRSIPIRHYIERAVRHS